MVVTCRSSGFLVALGVVALAATACDEKTPHDDSSEQAFVEKHVAKLEAAVAARSQTGVTVECATTATGLERLPAPLADKIRRLCYVEAPRLYLQLAVADVNDKNAAHPGMSDINCMQLFVGDALKILAQHPSTDPELQKLVGEYARLCPAQAAKAQLPR